jgi:hypothetical protein
MKQIEELLFIRAYLCPTRCVVAAGRPNLVSSLADACSAFQPRVSRIARIGETREPIRAMLARQELGRDVARLIREVPIGAARRFEALRLPFTIRHAESAPMRFASRARRLERLTVNRAVAPAIGCKPVRRRVSDNFTQSICAKVKAFNINYLGSGAVCAPYAARVSRLSSESSYEIWFLRSTNTRSIGPLQCACLSRHHLHARQQPAVG